MTTRKDEIEVFIQVKGLGFTFLLDNKMKHNLINPDFLKFFKEEYPAIEEEYQANQMAVEKLMRESEDAFPILPEPLKLYHSKVYIGKWVVRWLSVVIINSEGVKL